ncbi:hypothetical protein PVL29_008476 [Vitis rotundifolia]|uniref:Mediator of RNA polymerase II transcription subunit 33A n=1 Tax=Vitis rotundifolia TaxID=103349 RepID=A0AA38ZVW6_VITRO|nr:hypothetical protein PVL29_008476 [Vitis rotundifolia]
MKSSEILTLKGMAAVSVQACQVSQSTQPGLWDRVLELTKSAQERNSDPLLWAVQISSSLNSAGASLPSPELAHLLVSHICWANNVPITWKFLEKAVSGRIAPPMLVLALLSSRVIPNRRLYPAAYRLYMELLKRHTFSFTSEINGPNHQKIMKSIDDVLHLSQIFGLQVCEPGALVVEFIFSIVWQLLDASLDDEGLLELTPEKKSKWSTRSQDMDIDGQDSFNEKRTDRQEGLCKLNTVMAIEIIGEFFQNKVTSKILYLARRNMFSHWGSFIQRLRVLAANSTALRNSKHISPDALLQLTSDARRVLTRECKTSLQKQFHAVVASGSLISSAGQCHGVSWSALWLPIDMFLEDTMDDSQVVATSAVETLTGLVKALQAVNGTSWHNTFLGLWIAALRLVQRERDPSEGPVPRLDTCLCMLLSITPLAIVNIIEEEESTLIDEAGRSPTNQRKEKQMSVKHRKDLISSLQLLGDYEGLLTVPQSLSLVANQAVAKAMMSVSGVTAGSGYLDCMSMNDLPMNCSHGFHGSLAEIEKIYEIAVNGSDDEKISAAAILCGASLVRGWNIQEHTVFFITKLLSPPVPADYSGTDSHLIGYAPFLNVLLVGISSVDCVQIYSLHGLVPQLAGALMPICEVFGSCAPKVSWTLTTGEEISSHLVFSNAFNLLLRLWRFNHPPLEHVMGGDIPPVGSQLTPEYLLLVRNSQLANSGNTTKGPFKYRRPSRISSPSSPEPIFMDSFPKLKLWYRQHQACIASALSGLVHGTPVHQVVDAVLNMMFRKIGRGGQPLMPTASGSSNSSGSGPEDASLRLKLPAWDILEAIPFVLDAALTACAHGRLSPRELATGLKDLSDFLPASLATIASYFSAEVTRGIWKPAFMNGTDWPSPAANLSVVEQQIKKVLAATGVDVPSLAAVGSSPATLPLPLAALVSLTITYKLDRATDRLLTVVGPALNSLAAGCPWPCMPIIASLWAQKVKRWADYIIFSASRTVFHHKSDAVVQLLKSCFTSTLGLNSSPVSSNGGVGALLGHGFGSHYSGGMSPVAPGILYLRVHRDVRDVMFMTEVVLSLLMQSVRDIASCGLPKERLEKLKKTKYGMRYGQVSLAAAMTRVKLAASLGASIVWISGGLTLVQSLIKETLPSWFISVHGSEHEGTESEEMAAMLGGYALAYFAVLCGTFAWGVDLMSPASKRRPKVLGAHLEFLANALDGKISLGCVWGTWRAYVPALVTLMVGCTPAWIPEVDVEVLKRVSKGLRQWNEEELAIALLGLGGIDAMGAAAEVIVETG